MSDRWVLSRAGILNVYQYGDEVLHFGGGRLLLRGVNGSGKSSAMNMLLPFLLEADTRRIDASGVQSGVLRSWMLSGRDEPQPIGYLWLEVRRGEEHLVFGCGIRASRSTDNVTTWWFITDKRPGIDVNLLDGRTPRSLDSLREALGTDSAVFTRDQRVAYRSDLRSRLFAGADIAQHIRLLHVLRNPTVGDRIDTDLPEYLNEALPQLSEQAIDDAAQPLEDLEEHRDNVSRLTATDASMHALGAIYGGYARRELALAGNAALDAVERVARMRRDHQRELREVELAVAALADARSRVARLTSESHRLGGEIAALKDQPLYKEGQALEDLRYHVRTLDDAVRSVTGRRERVLARQAAEHDQAGQSVVAVATDRDSVVSMLGHLRSTLDAHGVAASVPDLPAIDLDLSVDGRGQREGAADEMESGVTVEEATLGPATGGPTDADGAPPEIADLVGRQLGSVRAAIRVRREDARDVQRSIDETDDAAAVLVQHEAATERSRAEHDSALVDLAEKQDTTRRSLAELSKALRTWQAETAAFASDFADAPDSPTAISDAIDLRSERGAVHDALDTWLSVLRRRVDREVATGEAQVADGSNAVAQASEELDALLDRAEPDPPLLAWQVPGVAPTLAELVDFADHVGDDERRGIEAAMEASGLLGATLRNGHLELDKGELVVSAGQPVAISLAEHLVVTLPATGSSGVDRDHVEAIIASIGTDPDSGDATVVADDGRFRIGQLSGRHERSRVELIGATARRAALERSRQEARDMLAGAEAELSVREAALDLWKQKRSAATALADRLPGLAEVDRSVGREDDAADLVDQRAAALEEVESVRRTAETARDQAEDTLRRSAATLRLPRVAAELRDVDLALTDSQHQLTRIDDALRSLDRSQSALSSARVRLLAVEREADEVQREFDAAVAEHEPLAARLATLEDSLGVAFQELLDALGLSEEELRRVDAEHPRAQAQVEQRTEQKATAAARAEVAQERLNAADGECLGHLDQLRSVLDVPGLTLAAWIADGAADATDDATEAEPFTLPTPPTVERTSDGVATLARWIVEQRPASPEAAAAGAETATDGEPDPTEPGDDSQGRPARRPVDSSGGFSADSVRMSLRQRRNTLGAGWDAEDRQPDPSLPMSIEVNGPEGRFSLAEAASVVRRRLHQQRGLLDAKQTQALRNLLQGLIAKEVAAKLHAARELIGLMNARLRAVSTAHGIGVSLLWRRRDDLDEELGDMIDLLAKPPDLRTDDEDRRLIVDISRRIDNSRDADPEAPYRELIASVLDYRSWHELRIMLHRGEDQKPQRLGRRTGLSEGEKKIVTYLPLFAAAAASCDAIAELEPASPRFVLLDDAFAKVSADNHEKLFGLLVEMDLDFIATSERLWGTHASVPELAITEVVRDAKAGVILLEHSTWNGSTLVEGADEAAMHRG